MSAWKENPEFMSHLLRYCQVGCSDCQTFTCVEAQKETTKWLKKLTTSCDPLTNRIIYFSVDIKSGLIHFSFNVDEFKA